MRKLILISLATALLASCTVPESVESAGQTICEHEAEARAALHLALLSATTIRDEQARAVAITGIQVSLAALDSCPGDLP